MINFFIKKEKDSSLYNLTLTKLVHKRSGEIVEEPGDTIYCRKLEDIKTIITHLETCSRLNNDVSLKEYLKEFYKAYEDVCELLKKTL